MGHVHINNPEYAGTPLDLVYHEGAYLPRPVYDALVSAAKVAGISMHVVQKQEGEAVAVLASKRTFAKILEEVKNIDYTVPGSFFVLEEELDAMSKSDRAKLGRVMYHGVGQITGAFLAKDKSDSGLTISWGQS